MAVTEQAMVNCESADALMVREADDALMPHERERLDRHAARCARCRARREANLSVKAVLARRVDADVPPSFAARAMARSTRAGTASWLAGIDWQRGTEWMLPVAAVLALLVVLAGGAASGTSETSNEQVSVEATGVTVDDLASDGGAVGQDMTSEELLAAMLGAPAATEGTANGR
jgi:anti-sigma factor RsiW